MSTALGLLLILILCLMALFLILVVLVQRGRGGGLAGALGGMGGQSAFGAKAGDTFTKITMWTATLWIILCILTVKLLPGAASKLEGGDQPEGFGSKAGTRTTAPLDPAGTKSEEGREKSEN